METKDCMWVLWGPAGFSVPRRLRAAPIFGGDAVVTLTHCQSAWGGLGMCLRGMDQMAVDSPDLKDGETTLRGDCLHMW